MAGKAWRRCDSVAAGVTRSADVSPKVAAGILRCGPGCVRLRKVGRRSARARARRQRWADELMKWHRVAPLGGAAMLAFACAAPASTLISKPPDVGPFWNPVGNNGSYVYADSFICPPVDTFVTGLGTWLEPLGAASSIVRFQ